MAQPLKALIIGAGSIGGLIDSPKSTTIASHAHAYTQCKQTQIAAICEPNELNAFAFMERWGEVAQYTCVDKVPQDKTFDIASVASSTASHFRDLATLLKRHDCTTILCEKPLVATREEFFSLSFELQKSDKKILIHLMRRYNPSFIALASRIQNQEFGALLGFQGACTKGLLHNGSHLLGVLTHFLGSINAIKPFRATYYHDDVCGEFGVSLERGEGTISILQSPDYSLFELTLWFENGAIKIANTGETIELYTKTPSTAYKGYNVLEASETIHTNLSHYALDSLEFLLRENHETCRAILNEHLLLHEHIFQALSKVYQS